MKKKKYFYFFFFRVFRLHIAITLLHTKDGMADRFIKDVTDAVGQMMINPEKPCDGQVNSLDKYNQTKDKNENSKALINLLIIRWRCTVSHKQ